MPRLTPASAYPKKPENESANRRPRKPLERGGLKPPPQPAPSRPGGLPPPAADEDLYANAEGSPLSNQIGEEVIEESPGIAEPISSDPMSSNGHSGAPFSQAQAGYTSGQQRCGGCSHFQQPSACEYVQGVIAADGSCPLHSELSGVGGGGGEVGLAPVEPVVEIESEREDLA